MSSKAHVKKFIIEMYVLKIVLSTFKKLNYHVFKYKITYFRFLTCILRTQVNVTLKNNNIIFTN